MATQRHAPTMHQPTQKLSSISSPYPFMKWSIDIVGPLVSSNIAKLRFLLVLTDYISKWIKAEAYEKITTPMVKSFISKNIICRHGLSYEIVTDNGPQFISKTFTDFCKKWRIKLKTASPRYQKCNGHTEAANTTIMNNLKKRLDLKKERWSEKLHGVLLACRTTPHTETQETSFSLSYRVKAVIPAEIKVSSQLRRMCPENTELNEEMLIDMLDMIEEHRKRAVIRIQNYQQAAARYYDSKIRNRSFSIGDLVLCKVLDGTREEGVGKLGTKWKVPYRITKEVRTGVQELEIKH